LEVSLSLSSEISQPTIELELKGSDLTIQSGDQVANVTLDQGADKSIWIVLAMIDGYLAAGNQNEEWLRRTLPAAETEINRLKESSKQSPRAVPRGAPITIETISGKLSVDQLLVFRDILYRGNGDSVQQTWEPDDRVIVLGDNVSASSDSRDRWPEGLLPNAIKGVVLQTDSAMETLLRQR